MSMGVEVACLPDLPGGDIWAHRTRLSVRARRDKLTLLARWECYSGTVRVRVKVSSGQILLVHPLSCQDFSAEIPAGQSADPSREGITL